MADDNNNQEYKGPGKTTSGVGRAVVEGGLLTAVAVGVAAIFSKNARAATIAAGKIFGNGAKATVHLVRGNGEGFAKAGEAAKHALDGITKNGAKIAGYTAASAAAVGGLHGLYKGASNSGKAENQVSELNASLDEQKSFVAKLNQEREQAKAPAGPAK